MATIRIGDRDCAVRSLRGKGGLKFKRTQIIPWRKRLAATPDTDEDAVVEAMVEGIHMYVGNDDVTKEWLEDNLPANLIDVFTQCVIASGEVVAPPGEAARP